MSLRRNYLSYLSLLNIRKPSWARSKGLRESRAVRFDLEDKKERNLEYSKSLLNIIGRFLETATFSKKTFDKTNFTTV